MRKQKGKKWLLKVFTSLGIVLFLGGIILFSDNYKAAIGIIEHKHSWETPSSCGTCGGDHSIETYKNCSTCNGVGKAYRCVANIEHYNSSTKVNSCPTCGNVVSYVSCDICGGDGKVVVSSKECTKCYASGTYKGKNTRCTRSGCSKNSYAAWSEYPNGVCYTETAYTKVTFNINDGRGYTASQTFTYGESGNKFGHNADGTAKWGTSGQFGAWDRAGYTLLGWSESPTATSATYSVYSGVTDGWIEQKYPSVTLYAVWQAKSVSVTFHKNDGSGATASQSFTAGVSINKFGYNADGSLKWGNSGQFGVWDRSGYKLLGWSTNASATTATYNPYSGVTDGWIGSNSPRVNLYAIWSNCTHTWEITATFLGVDCTRQCTACGKEQVATWCTVSEGITEYNFEPLYEGYKSGTIAGLSWLFDEDGNPTHTGAWHDTGTEVTLTVTAEDGYELSCLQNGGDIHINENSYTFIKNGASTWTAVAWKDIVWEETGLLLGRTKSCSICGDSMEYTVWIGKDDMLVTANNPNYSEVAYSDDLSTELYLYPEGETVSFTVSGEPGYKYYWSMDSVDYPDSDTISFTITGAKGLTAKKTPNTFTVTYNANGGAFSDGTTADKTEIVTYNENVPLNFICEKEGYEFVGWALFKTDTVTLPYLQMPAKDITLYAMYSLPVSDVEKALLVVWSIQNSDTVMRYPFVLSGETVNAYIFTATDMDLTQGLEFSSVDDVFWKIEIYDHAGNVRELIPENTPEPPPVVECYMQTVEHYIWIENIVEGGGEYKYLASTQEKVEKNKTFTPVYLSKEDERYPAGYYNYSIDAAYVVSGETTTKAYYKPTAYKLIFDANGGTCETEYKTAYYAHIYGPLPDAEKTQREGYDFLGWFTEAEGGAEVTAKDIHSALENRTIYAHWNIHKHTVTYDYWTNGGTSASSGEKDSNFGAAIDLNVIAVKQMEGWEHIGWNINPEATVSMTSFSSWYCGDCRETHYISSMPDHKVTLYAIYKKDITATFVDPNPETETKKEVTIYNKAESAEIVIPENMDIEGWSSNGWSTGTEADASVEFSAGSTYEITDNITFYGIYTKPITLFYDTNASAQAYEAQIGTRHYNASGMYKNPVFIVMDGPSLDNHSFVKWSVTEGTVENISGTPLTQCAPGDSIMLLSDATLQSLWDQFPAIEAYDRYFTLKEAKEGKITETELLEKVKGTDKEDGTLINGSGVIVLNYNASIFTGITTEQSIETIYQATDSFGNIVTKTVAIRVIDTTTKRSKTKKYVRFISSQFFADSSGNLISSNQGGLEETSIWRTNTEYRTLLQKTLEKIIKRSKNGLP